MLALVVALSLQHQPLPSVNVNAYLPGQREVILGVRAYPEVMMQVGIMKDMVPSFPAKNGEVTGGGLYEKTLGWVRWSAKPDTFGGKPCIALKCEGDIVEPLSKTVNISAHDIQTYWVDENGKILRQYNLHVVNAGRPSTANCVYDKDSINVSIEDSKGRRSTTAYPNFDMSELHDQFKPMMKGEEVILREKTYRTFDPFTLKFDKVSVRISGSVVGSYFNLPFRGKAFEIVSSTLTQTAAISTEGDLVKVDLPHSRQITMQNMPPGKGGAG